MKVLPRLLLTVTLASLAGAAAEAGGPRWSVGVNFGWPAYYHRPYHPYYVVPAPVYAVPPPIFYAAPPYPVYSAPPAESPPPPPAPPVEPGTLPPPRRVDEAKLTSYEHYRRELTSADERVRLDAVTQLGRSKSPAAVDALASTLAGDGSKTVREAAAKALGIIGAPSALPALRRAAQQDGDHDVRRTAQFAIEIIQSK